MNRTREQAKKYAAITAPNGYKFDAFRFLYGMSHGDEYPAFIRTVSEDDEKTTYRRIYFFKYWDKSAAICVDTFSIMKNGEAWQVINDNPNYKHEKLAELPQGARFSVKTLLTYCNL